MSELTSMINIGQEMTRKLTSIGIDSPEKLVETGSKQALLKQYEFTGFRFREVCFTHLTPSGIMKRHSQFMNFACSAARTRISGRNFL